MSIELPKDYYNLVEEKNKLKYMLYSDSIYGNAKIVYKLNNEIYINKIEKLWDKLQQSYQSQIINEKEYIFCNNIEILNYDLTNDRIIFTTPSYIMRHHHNGEVYINHMTNYSHIITTLDHSFVDIDVKNREYLTKTPEEINYIPVLRNNNTQLTNISFLYWILGNYYGDGEFNSYYPKLSTTNINIFVDFLHETFNDDNFKFYVGKHKHDAHINYLPLRKILLKQELNGIRSTNRTLTKPLFNLFKKDFNKFFSFLLGYWVADGTLTSGTLIINSSNLIVLNQLKDLLNIHQIYSDIKIYKNGRKYKDKISGDMYMLSLKAINDHLFEHFEYFSEIKKISNFSITSFRYGRRYDTIFYNETTQKNQHGIKFGILRNAQESEILLHNIKPVKIQNKEKIQYTGYVYDLEVPSNHTFIIDGMIVHNTDSLYLNLPIKNLDKKDKWTVVEKHTKIINDLISEKMDEILIKQNLNPKYNKTVFKSEMLMSDICFLAKKMYAYKLENQEGLNEAILYSNIKLNNLRELLGRY